MKPTTFTIPLGFEPLLAYLPHGVPLRAMKLTLIDLNSRIQVDLDSSISWRMKLLDNSEL